MKIVTHQGVEIKQEYHLIVVDPPWRYRRSKQSRYQTMSMEELKALKLPTKKDCGLLLWVTMPFLEKGFELMKSWGFTYKTNFFTWVKLNRKQETPFFGTGSYTASNVELLLLGTRGSITPFIKKHVSSLVFEPVRGHSQKPEYFKTLLHEIFPNIPKLEMFARCTLNPSYHYFGNEIEKYFGKNEEEIQTMLKKSKRI